MSKRSLNRHIANLGTLITLAFDSDKRFKTLRDMGLTDHMDDRKYLERLWRCNMGYRIDLSHPLTYNEKLQWIKLNDRDPLYHILVDKIAVKGWVAERIGEDYIIPTLGTWENPDDIDFDTLPDQFAIKCNHNSGLGMYICSDRSKMDVSQVRDGLKHGLEQDYYLTHREWAYKDFPRRILAEEYIADTDEISERFGLLDYKVHCFSGEPDFIEVIGNRDHIAGTGQSDNYDFTWRKLDWRFGDYPPFTDTIPQPCNLSELYDVTRELSQGLRYARVDFYNINGHLKFGEITLYPSGGLNYYNDEYTPAIDRMLGDKIHIDQDR